MQYKDEQCASCINTELKRNPKTVAPAFSGVLHNSRGESMQSWNALYRTLTVNIQKKIISLKRKFQPPGFHLVGTDREETVKDFLHFSQERRAVCRFGFDACQQQQTRPDSTEIHKWKQSNSSVAREHPCHQLRPPNLCADPCQPHRICFLLEL